MAAFGFTATEQAAAQQSFSTEQSILGVSVAMTGFGTRVRVVAFTAGSASPGFGTGATAIAAGAAFGSFTAGSAMSTFGTRPATGILCALVCAEEGCLANGYGTGSLSFAATWDPNDAFVVSCGETCH